MAWRELKRLSGEVGNKFKVEYDTEEPSFRVILSGSTVKEGLEAFPTSIKEVLRNPKTAQELLMDVKSLLVPARALVNGWIDDYISSVKELAMWRHIPTNEAKVVVDMFGDFKRELANLRFGNDFWMNIAELYQRGNLENEVVLFFDACNGKFALRIDRTDIYVSRGLGNDFAYACGLMRCVFTALERGIGPFQFETWVDAVMPKLLHFHGNPGKEIARLLLLMPNIPPEYQDQHAPTDDDENETIGQRVARRHREEDSGERPAKKPRRG